MNNVLLEIKDEIAFVTVNRPKSLNALNFETLCELEECFVGLSKRKDVKALIITGAGEKAFVAGADISEMIDMDGIQGRAMANQAQKAFMALDNMPQVAIAAVNGFALGGGCELAMSCDIRIVADTAKFGQPEVNLGIIPGFTGTQRLSRLIGRGRAKELIFTTDSIDAQEAYRLGLANKVVPKSELMDSCVNLAKKIMSKGSFAISLAKSAINQGSDVDSLTGYQMEADMFGLCFTTQDKSEGMNAFLEKRPAKLSDF